MLADKSSLMTSLPCSVDILKMYRETKIWYKCCVPLGTSNATQPRIQSAVAPDHWKREYLLKLSTSLHNILERETSSHISIASFIDHYIRQTKESGPRLRERVKELLRASANQAQAAEVVKTQRKEDIEDGDLSSSVKYARNASKMAVV